MGGQALLAGREERTIPELNKLHMAQEQDEHSDKKIFTLSEATSLLPQLAVHLTKAKQGKAILLHTKDEIKKASAKAEFGGGSVAGPRYIQALENIHDSMQTVHEFGVIVKDLEQGLCDFPFMLDGRVVYLCWRLGEEQIEWWHEIDSGFAGRQPLPKNP